MRTLVLLAAIILLVLIVRMLYRQSPQKVAQFMSQFGLALFVVVFLFLLMTGRLPWVLGLFAAAIPFAKKLLPLLRYVPFMHGLYQRYQTNRQNAAGPSAGQTSSVESDFVRMILEHDSGMMDGEILRGPHQGAKLSALKLDQLLSLFTQWQGNEDSIALLQAYLDRMHPDWQSQAGASFTEQQYSGAGNGNVNGRESMSRSEALQILGLSDDAAENITEQEIIDAHRRLMQKLHPDRGGSTYLAAKINLAKEYLLKHIISNSK